ERIACVRGLNLARALLSAAARSNASSLSPQQWAQLENQDRQLLVMRDMFAMRVKQYLAALNATYTSQSVSEKQKTTVNACATQLAGERRELASGTAKVRTFAAK